MATQPDKIVFEVEIDGKQAENSLGGLEDRIEKLRDLQKGEQIGSKAFNDLSKDIQKAESAIKDVELQFESLDMEQKLTAGSDAVVGLAGGFAAASGAMAIMGTESEALEETLTKVAGALALSQGLRDLANGAIALRKLGGAAEIARKAQVALNAAVKANPYTALAAAILAIAAAVVIFVVNQKAAQDSLDVTVQKTKELNQARLDSLKAVSKEKQSLSTLLKVAKDETKSKELREKAIEKINKISPAYLGNINLENINSQKVAKSIDKYTEAIERKARAQAFSGKLAELEAQILDEQIKTNDTLAKEEVKRFNILGQVANNIEAITTNQSLADIQAKKGLAAANDRVKVLETRKEALIELLEAEQEGLLEDEIITDTFEALQVKQSSAVEKKTEIELDALEKLSEGRVSSFEELQELLQAEIEIRDEALKDNLAGVQREADEEISIRQQVAMEMAQLSEEQTERELAAIAKEDEARQKQLDKAQLGVDFLNGINNAFVKDEAKREKIRKALAIAQIAIDTARAVSGAIAAGAAVPFPANIPAILTGVTAVLAGIASAKNIIGGADSGISASSITSAATGADGAQLNNVSNTASLINQDQQNLGQQIVLPVESFNEVNNNVNVTESAASY